MHPDHAEQLVDDVRHAALYHLQVRVTRVTPPTPSQFQGGQHAALVEGEVMHLFRNSVWDPISEASTIRFEVEPCIPTGRVEFQLSSPCISGDELEAAEYLEVYLDAEKIAHQAAVRPIPVPTPRPAF